MNGFERDGSADFVKGLMHAAQSMLSAEGFVGLDSRALLEAGIEALRQLALDAEGCSERGALTQCSASESNNHYELSEGSDLAWVGVENLTVKLKRSTGGLKLDVFARGGEDLVRMQNVWVGFAEGGVAVGEEFDWMAACSESMGDGAEVDGLGVGESGGWVKKGFGFEEKLEEEVGVAA